MSQLGSKRKLPLEIMYIINYSLQENRNVCGINNNVIKIDEVSFEGGDANFWLYTNWSR